MIKKSPGPALLSALLCDDIREESSGKQTVVGVYPDRIAPAAFPASLKPSLFTRFYFPKRGVYRVMYRFRNGTGVMSESGWQEIKSERDDAVEFSSMTNIPLELAAPDFVIFEWAPEDGDWADMVQLRVMASGTKFE